MPWMPSYDVYIAERFELEPIEPGQTYPGQFKDASWSGEADSPESAIDNVRAEWRRKYNEDPPVDAEVKIELGPNVCPRCEGRGWRPGDTYGLPDPGEASPLGSTAKRRCQPCNGTGNITQRR